MILESTLNFIESIKNDEFKKIESYIINSHGEDLLFIDEKEETLSGNVLDVLIEHIHFTDLIDYSPESLKILNEKVKVFPEFLEMIKNKNIPLKCKYKNMANSLIDKGIGHEIVSVMFVANKEIFKESSLEEKISFLEKLICNFNNPRFLKIAMEEIKEIDGNYNKLLFSALEENLYIDNFDYLIKYKAMNLNYKNESGISVFENLCLLFGFKNFERNITQKFDIDYLDYIYEKKKVSISSDFLKNNNLLPDVRDFLAKKISLLEKNEINNNINIMKDEELIKKRL